MVRGEKLLEVKKLDAALKKGEAKRIKDGGGLELRVDDRRARWVFRFTLAGKDRELGLGAYPDVTLAMARTGGMLLGSCSGAAGTRLPSGRRHGRR
jgi:Arm DNA-binding domain